ncbi:ankyrin repeat domain-containing protein, partial [Streptomyces sp. NPDC059556]|uniref:ankyrin repeat domain-containing protein n=1 Tax=Streptomyces sp. NPDC059556 TaxID=3346863 RepID=UPI0036CBAA47
DLRPPPRTGVRALTPRPARPPVATVRAVLAETAIDVDHVNRLGWTALLEAVILGTGGRTHQDVVALLLAAGADPGIRDPHGDTALDHATRHGLAEIADLLKGAPGARSGSAPGAGRRSSVTAGRVPG